MRRTLVSLCLLAACSPGTTDLTGRAIADSLALACDTVLAPSEADDGRVEQISPGPAGLMTWSQTWGGTELKVGTSNASAITVGRAGAGPGEFKMATVFGWLGDTLWAGDMQLARIQFFTKDGTLIRGVQLRTPESWIPVPGDRFLAIANKPVGVGGWSVLGMDTSMTKADTLYTFPGPPTERMTIPMGGGASLLASQPFAATAVAAWSPDGSRWCATEPHENSTVTLRCIDGTGHLTRDTVLTLVPEPLTDAIWEATVAGYLQREGTTREGIVASVKRPANLPLIKAMLVDHDGAVWLKRSFSSETTQRWMRLTSSGALRDTLLINPRYTIRALSGDSLWMSTSDENDMQTVVRCSAKK